MKHSLFDLDVFVNCPNSFSDLLLENSTLKLQIHLGMTDTEFQVLIEVRQNII